MDSMAPFHIRARVMSGGEIAMGPGKADLLEAIEANGSISAAGRAMGMSYRRAWLLVDAMNRCWSAPLVETVSGGSHERGARLTELGQRVLEAYRLLQHRLAQALGSDDLSLLKESVRAEPVAPKQG